MKQTLLYFFLLISTANFAQAIAELKFEEAETAFNQGNYELALKKVDEFEKAVGGMSDKSLFLRVISQNKLFNPANFYTDEKQFSLYNSLSANAEKYINVMESKGLDDKFKEIYGISEKLNNLNFPNDKKAYQKEKQRIIKEKQEKLDQCNKAFDDLTIDNLPFDITIEEFLAQYPNVLSKKKYKLTKGTKFDLYQPKDIYMSYSTLNKFDFLGVLIMYGEPKLDIGDITILVKNDKIIGYQKQIYWYVGKDLRLQELENKYTELSSRHLQLSDCAALKYDFENLPDGIRQVFYWKFNNKTALISQTYTKPVNWKSYFHSLIYRVTKTTEPVEGF